MRMKQLPETHKILAWRVSSNPWEDCVWLNRLGRAHFFRFPMGLISTGLGGEDEVGERGVACRYCRTKWVAVDWSDGMRGAKS